MARIILAGGSGFLGRHLAQRLIERHDEVFVLTRDPCKVVHGTGIEWDGRHPGPWKDVVDGSAAVINLTGRSVDCRYNWKNRRAILVSRLASVRAIHRAISQARQPPRVVIQAASLAIYGDASDRICDDDAAHGSGFSPGVCERWERAFLESELPDTRRVLLRIGFVLAHDGGALRRLGALTRLGLGGRVGNGKQQISWIHIDDMIRLLMTVMDDARYTGVYNATGPAPVTNARFMQAMRKTLRRPWSPPTPPWAVRLGARLMGTEAELALSGRQCVSTRLRNAGFTFQYTSIEDALTAIYRRPE